MPLRQPQSLPCRALYTVVKGLAHSSGWVPWCLRQGSDRERGKPSRLSPLTQSSTRLWAPEFIFGH